MRAMLQRLAQRNDVDAVLLTGGTGIARRDQTYETVSSLLTKPLPGYGELFRMLSYQEIGTAAMLSRAVGRLDGPHRRAHHARLASRRPAGDGPVFCRNSAIWCARRGGNGDERMLPGIKLFDLTGKSAIVTGGSKGLGEAMAAGLASAGADVLLASRHEDEAVAAAAEIAAEYGCQAIGL